MHEYEVKLIVEGRNVKVTVNAYNGAEARRNAEAMYGGDVRYISCRRVD